VNAELRLAGDFGFASRHSIAIAQTVGILVAPGEQ
jgi:hypothetical protein